jgi:hypothetical protein
MRALLVLLGLLPLISCGTPMTIFVDPGEGKEAAISFGGPGKKVVMKAKDNVFSIAANQKEVLTMMPLAKDSAAFTPEVIGSFSINSITAKSIVSDDFEIVNPQAPTQQWLAVHHDTFENSTLGWEIPNGQPLELSQCGGVTLLGGPCKTSYHIMSKTFQLPKHAQIQVTARFHFIDNWDDDTAFMSLSSPAGQTKAWLEQYSWCSQFFTMMCAEGHSACGKDKYPDKLSRLISVSMEHNEPSLTVQFGTNIGQEIPPCEVSYGISGVVIEVR